MIVERTVRLTYPAHLLRQPLISQLIRRYDLLTNIIEAQVTADRGYLVLAIHGDEGRVQEGLDWMAAQGVAVEILSELTEEP